MKLVDVNKNLVIASKVKTADNFFLRLKGLIGSKKLEDNECLVIKPCSSIHTIFMSYSIDVIFLDDNWNVLDIKYEVKPWKLALSSKGAKVVVELPGGFIKRTGLKLDIGDKIDIL